MIVGSLFSGVGGFDLGLEQAGHHVQWQCEADEWRRRVLATHWPTVACAPDVRDVRIAAGQADQDARSTSGESAVSASPLPRHGVDLICGGFPCQDLSVAGRRAGLISGERSSLFFECARVADELLRPGGWLLLENVPGLLSSNSGRDFGVLLATLADLGFHDVAWRVLDSRFFGVAQRRRRVFILARRARGSRSRSVLLEPEGRGGDPAPRGEAGARTAGALGLSFALRRDPGGTGQQHNTDYIVTNAPDRMAGGKDDNSVTAFAGMAQAGAGWAPASMPTLEDCALPLDTTRASTAAIGQGVRRLTPTECERLQGFPDGWTALPGAPDSRRYAAMGDAVTVPVARWIGERLAVIA